ARFAAGLKAAGVEIAGESLFDTVTVKIAGKAADLAREAEKSDRLIRVLDADTLGVTFDETSTEEDLKALAALFGAKPGDEDRVLVPGNGRGEGFLTQDVFHSHRSETEMMRFLRRLADKDLA